MDFEPKKGSATRTAAGSSEHSTGCGVGLKNKIDKVFIQRF
jgi:hypothetical protein